MGIETIQYRYCRNLQCDSSPEVPAEGRILTPGSTPQVSEDTVTGWQWWQGVSEPAVVPPVDIVPRNPGFIAGIGWTSSGFRPAWRRGFPAATAETAGLNANWLLLQPTWSVDPGGSPQLVFNPVQDFDGEGLVQAIQAGQSFNLQVALYPHLTFPGSPETDSLLWWQAAPRTFGWWVSWFESYRQYLLNFASLAEQRGVGALVLGGEWLSPSFTWGLLPDGSFSWSPGDADERWLALIAEVRTFYHGRLLWVVPYNGQPVAPSAFTSLVDGILVTWSEGLSPQPSYDAAGMAAVVGALLDEHVRELRVETGKPIILALSYPSARGSSSGCVQLADGCAAPGSLLPGAAPGEEIILDLQEQEAVYNAMFSAIAARDWLDGVIVMDFYPALPVQDLSASVNAKPASGVVWYWFGKFLGK